MDMHLIMWNGKRTLSSRYFSVLRVWRRWEYYQVERAPKIQVTMDLERATLVEENSWSQKLWELQLREWDKCTKFSHRVANSLKRNNTIKMMVVYGVLSSNLP